MTEHTERLMACEVIRALLSQLLLSLSLSRCLSHMHANTCNSFSTGFWDRSHLKTKQNNNDEHFKMHLLKPHLQWKVLSAVNYSTKDVLMEIPVSGNYPKATDVVVRD